MITIFGRGGNTGYRRSRLRVVRGDVKDID